jgi:hypothetical protein
LAIDAAEGFVVSPDETKVAWVSSGTLRVRPLSGGAAITLATGVTGSPRWSPVSHALLWSEGVAGSATVYWVGATSGAAVNTLAINALRNPVNEQIGEWSPGGTPYCLYIEDPGAALITRRLTGAPGGFSVNSFIPLEQGVVYRSSADASGRYIIRVYRNGVTTTLATDGIWGRVSEGKSKFWYFDSVAVQPDNTLGAGTLKVVDTTGPATVTTVGTAWTNLTPVFADDDSALTYSTDGVTTSWTPLANAAPVALAATRTGWVFPFSWGAVANDRIAGTAGDIRYLRSPADASTVVSSVGSLWALAPDKNSLAAVTTGKVLTTIDLMTGTATPLATAVESFTLAPTSDRSIFVVNFDATMNVGTLEQADYPNGANRITIDTRVIPSTAGFVPGSKRVLWRRVGTGTAGPYTLFVQQPTGSGAFSINTSSALQLANMEASGTYMAFWYGTPTALFVARLSDGATATVDSNVSPPRWIGGKLLYLKVGELILATPQ